MKIFLIYNPHAGAGRAKKLLPKVKEKFASINIDLEVYVTEYPSHGTEVTAGLDFSEYDGIVAGGGDGTLFEVINGYFQNPSKKRIPIGVLPVGTGNAFAKDLDLDSSKWEEAIEIISMNRPRKVDVGKFTTEGKVFYYLNILGLGFVSDVTKTALKLKFFGNVAYLLGVLYETIRLKSHKLSINIDGKKYERDNIFVEISNTTYTSNFLMAPTAEIDDGILDVTLLAKCTRRQLLKALPTVFTGEHVNLDIVETFKAKKIEIETNIPKVLTPDGEVLGSTPIKVECLKQAVEVFGR
ncbi:diacylglycerol kinase family lipid kinase [bacterium]|nr:diacylglycerol kinase family lipid kinase [bacterium]